MKITAKKVRLVVEIDNAAYSAAKHEEYLRVRGRYNMPGFRNGKAPMGVIEKAYGALVFFDNAFNKLYREYYDKAVEKFGLSVVGEPEFEVIAVSGLEDDNGKAILPPEVGVRFDAIVNLEVEVELSDYKAIEAARPEYPVTEAHVDAEIAAMQRERARLISVERSVENGDVVKLDYAGSVDGVFFDGGTASDQELEIGSGHFIPGFEEQMIGMAIGEERDLKVTFPTEYHAQELAGKEANFHVKVNEIFVRELPELDDEFAQDASESATTMEELRAEIRKEHEAANAERADRDYRDLVIEKMIEGCKLEAPLPMIYQKVEEMMADMNDNFRRQGGFTLEMYCQYTGTTLDQMRIDLMPNAESRVKQQLVLDAIAEAEGISVSDEEVNEIIDSIISSEENEEQRNLMKARINDEIRENIRESTKYERAQKLVFDSVKEPAQAETEEKPEE
ncbi:MAG: trigger factor [Clostridia bacterium]|nr:trigger factor [Clostridia bacterium]